MRPSVDRSTYRDARRLPIIDNPLCRFTVEPHEDGWAVVASGEVVAITPDRPEAETLAKLAEARAGKTDEQHRAG